MEAKEVSNPQPPDIVVFPGEWPPYEEALFQIFKADFLGIVIQFQGLPVRIKKHPAYKEKHFAFWHLISEGKKEEERIPDFRRCERLPWVRWVIESCDRVAGVSCWENKRGSHKHVVIWFEKENYVVILERRKTYFLLKTAYIAGKYRTKSFATERDEFKKKKP